MEIPYTLTARPDTGLYNGKLGIWLFLASEVMLFGAIFTAYLFLRLGAEDGTWPDHVQNVWLGLTNTIFLLASSITMVWAWVALKERNFNLYRIALGITILLGLAFLSIKGVEYYSKYEHFGFFIQESAFPKYKDILDKDHDYYSVIPSEHIVEVRGHWHGETDDSITFLSDKDPHAPGKVFGAMYTGASEDDTPVTLDKKDIDPIHLWGRLLPAYGTYYAVYFLVTGLHALHIIGGVIVMTYFLTIGSALYRRNPEQLSNRIEVTGIFWHFVDLVWITVFPILYLT